jgi:hypothetical protein
MMGQTGAQIMTNHEGTEIIKGQQQAHPPLRSENIRQDRGGMGR